MRASKQDAHAWVVARPGTALCWGQVQGQHLGGEGGPGSSPGQDEGGQRGRRGKGSLLSLKHEAAGVALACTGAQLGSQPGARVNHTEKGGREGATGRMGEKEKGPETRGCGEREAPRVPGSPADWPAALLPGSVPAQAGHRVGQGPSLLPRWSVGCPSCVDGTEAPYHSPHLLSPKAAPSVPTVT